jgi:DNA-binding MarR family transcriptional regulator
MSSGHAATGEGSPEVADEALEVALASTVPLVLRHLLSHARRRPAWTDMTHQQYSLLREVAHHPATQTDIARRLMVTPPVATRQAGALVDDGLLERHEDPADRRAVLLALTPAGRRRVADMERDLIEAARELLEPLPAEQRQAVADALEQLQLLVPSRLAAR